MAFLRPAGGATGLKSRITVSGHNRRWVQESRTDSLVSRRHCCGGPGGRATIGLYQPGGRPPGSSQARPGYPPAQAAVAAIDVLVPSAWATAAIPTPAFPQTALAWTCDGSQGTRYADVGSGRQRTSPAAARHAGGEGGAAAGDQGQSGWPRTAALAVEGTDNGCRFSAAFPPRAADDRWYWCGAGHADLGQRTACVGALLAGCILD